MSTADSLRQHGPDGKMLCRRSFDRYLRWDADLPADLVDRLWHDPHALLAEGDRLQDKPRCSVVRLDHPAGLFVLKHHNWGNVSKAIRKSLSQSVAFKSWADARFLYSAGVPTPRPCAYVERRFGPFKRWSYLLSDYIAGTSLYRFMRFERASNEFIQHLARQVAAIWQQLDDLCVWHNDFKTENVLVDPHGKVWLIDFERMRHFRDRDRMRRRQVRDISDFFHPRNWRSNPEAAELFRRELLETRAATETLMGMSGATHPLIKPAPQINRPSQLVTVLIPCRNAADTIVTCVKSIRDVADEVLVADAGSTDDTVRLVRNIGGCRIVQSQCADNAAFEFWAQSHARHPWIFRILPSEQLNSELGRQVQDIVATEPPEDGFRVSRIVYFRGHLLKRGGFQRESSIRLYRKNAGRFLMHDGRVEVDIDSNKVGRLPSRLFHESCPSIDAYLKEMIRVADRAADDGRRNQRRPTRRRAVGQAAWQLLRSYILRFGFLDGWAGLHASCLSAFAIYLREAMLWEMHEPAVARSTVVRDTWQELKVFDPTTASESGGQIAIATFTVPDEVAPAATDDLAARQMRPAA